ncbi:hypothetical protein BTVI_39409 [Pitangus sulphuratus]|nr:hypothetical protein BTVI_39409 [Pitangus sulphuratus]
MPVGSRMDFLPLAKAKPIRSNSSTSVITYLRTESGPTLGSMNIYMMYLHDQVLHPGSDVLPHCGSPDRDKKLNSTPVIKEETVNDLLSHLDPHKSMGPDGIHPRVMRELAEEIAKPLSIIYQQSWLTGEVPNPRKGPEGGPGKLQACQPDLSAWQGYGADHPSCNHTAPTGQTRDQSQPAQV